MDAEGAKPSPRVYGRYVVHHELASGGMASVHIGRLIGPVGFSRTVAIKILHPQYAKDPEFVAMFVDEARLAARIRHPNVVSTIDVVAKGADLLLVMDYVPGETLSRLQRMAHLQGQRIPIPVVSAIVVDLLDGLHAAHEARDEQDAPLSIVHRDVSPQNVMVGLDGTTRVLDFGIANATSRVQTTRDGELKGKFAYMSPEQVNRENVDRRTDVFAAAIVLWEALTGIRLFAAESPAAIVSRLIHDPILPPSTLVEDLSPALDDVVMKGLSRNREARYPTADAFARALEDAQPSARRSDVRAWVERTANAVLEERARRVADIENTPTVRRPSAVALDALPDLIPTDVPIVHEETTQQAGAAVPPPTRARKAGLAAAAALIGSLALALTLWHPAQTASSPQAFATAPLPPETTSAPAPPSPSAIPGLASAAAPPALVSSSSPASAPSVAATSPRAPRSAAARQANPCDPPYTFTDAGAKRWKPACL